MRELTFLVFEMPDGRTWELRFEHMAPAVPDAGDVVGIQDKDYRVLGKRFDYRFAASGQNVTVTLALGEIRRASVTMP